MKVSGHLQKMPSTTLMLNQAARQPSRHHLLIAFLETAAAKGLMTCLGDWVYGRLEAKFDLCNFWLRDRFHSCRRTHQNRFDVEKG